MPPPIRCFTCGRLLGNKWERYFQLLHDGMCERDAMTAVKIPAKQYCCRALMLTTIDDSDKYNVYKDHESTAFQFLSDDPKKKTSSIFSHHP